jgi:hypothetical protein
LDDGEQGRLQDKNEKLKKMIESQKENELKNILQDKSETKTKRIKII